MIADALVLFFDIRVGPIIGTLRRIPDRNSLPTRRYRIAALDERGSPRPPFRRHRVPPVARPITVVRADKADDVDVVQEAGESYLFVHPGPDRVSGTLL